MVSSACCSETQRGTHRGMTGPAVAADLPDQGHRCARTVSRTGMSPFFAASGPRSFTLTAGFVVLVTVIGSLLAVPAAGDSTDADDIKTCGGFIRSSVSIPYERVKIKLLTRTGNLKSETDGAPNNGYFLLPAYDKGQFQLRVEGPPGWTFDPPSLDLVLDGSGNDPCSRAQDIDFTFKGFSVIGKVVSAGSLDGPEKVPVSLIEGGSRRTVFTQKGGNFAFPGVMPGVYQLTFRGQSMDVKVTNDNFVLDKASPFVIEGYALQGKIGWTDSRPASAWAVLAVAGAFDDATAASACCGRSPQPTRQLPAEAAADIAVPSGLRVACVAEVDLTNGGAFEFPCVKSTGGSQSYVVLPLARTTAGKPMEISPDRVDVELLHGDAQLKPFQVTGFPVDGQVQDVGEGVEVQVLETGYETVTDAAGRFTLPGMRRGQYTLSLKKRGVQFEPRVVEVSVDRAVLAAIRPNRYEVCGEAKVTESVELQIVNVDKSSPDRITKAFSDVSSGRFCAMLPRGDYVLRPVGRVHLSPAEVPFSVPVPAGKRFVFSQFQAVIGGRVSCLGGVCAGVRVELRGGTGPTPIKQVANSDGSFRFERMDPGTYEVCVAHSSLCFEKDCQGITVVDKNVDDVAFVQKGFVLRLDSTHGAELEVGGRVLQVKSGLSTHCVVETKPTPLTPRGCHRFARAASLIFRPGSDDTVKLVAESHRLRVNINTKIAVDDLKLSTKTGDEVHEVELKKHASSSGSGTLPSDENASPSFVYSTEMYLAAGKELLLEASSASLVFRPSQTVVRMPNDCHAVELQGKTGIFIEGSVQPPIAGVEIVVTAEGAAPIDAVRVLTGANGTYRAGPLESARYSIEGHKEGYAFERIGDTTNLSGIKFSRIDIVVQQEDSNAPLGGALVSVTGGPEYRNNSRTDANGELSLIRLAPGSYYIRVMMKEYKFEPVSTMVQVSENSEERVVIRGKKVAYSVMGRVTSITGEAESDVALEAISDACDRHEEDATSDDNGNFRIRGLREGCTYELRLKRADADAGAGAHGHVHVSPQGGHGESASEAGSSRRFERTLPAVREVHVGRKDLHVDVLVVRPQRGTQLSVAVDADPTVMASLRVVVLSAGGRQLHSLPASRFVVVPGELARDGSEITVELQRASSGSSSGTPLGSGNGSLHSSGGAGSGSGGRGRSAGGSSGPASSSSPSSATVRADRVYRHVRLRYGANGGLPGAGGHPGLGTDATPGPTPFVAVFSVFVALAVMYRNDIAEFLHRRHQDTPATAGTAAAAAAGAGGGGGGGGAGDRRKNKTRLFDR